MLSDYFSSIAHLIRVNEVMSGLPDIILWVPQVSVFGLLFTFYYPEKMIFFKNQYNIIVCWFFEIILFNFVQSGGGGGGESLKIIF